MSGTNEPQLIPDIFFRRTAIAPQEEALSSKINGRWVPVTWKEYEQNVRDLARGLSDWVQPKEIVAILSENRPEWCYSDLAILSLGAVSAPIYPTNPPKDIAYILNDCGAKVICLSTKGQLEKIRKLRAEDKIPKVERVVIFEEIAAEEDWVITLSAVCKRNAEAADPIEARLAEVKPEDLGTLIYTSGTTGEPKGVMLSHKNIVRNTLGAAVVLDHIPLEEKQMLSFLPLSHVLERTAGYYAALHFGFKVAFAESIPKLVDNMGEVRPTMLVSVPRIYEKLYSRMMEQAQSGLKKKLIFWALDTGGQRSNLMLAGKSVPLLLKWKYAIATKLVFSNVHKKMGGRLRYAISGGAPLGKELGEFLNAIGLTAYEGYGLSETSPVLAASQPGAMKMGTVGKPWPEVEIKIVPEPDRENDGEIVARGPNIMLGYYNKPEATAEVLDQEGWLKTGDIGFIDDEGFLHITDRKKELIKTAGGKYVAPTPIEGKLKIHPLVEQVVMIGDRRKYCVALIVPSFEGLEAALGRPMPADRSKVNDDPQVMSLIQEAVDKVNADQGSWEQIKRFCLLPAEMTQETGELTPSMKVKRRIVDEMHKEQIDALYPS